MSSVAVIDYGMGNLHSIAKALQHAAPDVTVHITANATEVLRADRVVFPGVGAIRDCMHALKQIGLDEVIQEVAQTKPLLGICLGMQALLGHSAENDGTDCLNVIAGNVLHFADDLQDSEGNLLKIPHMGWNQVCQQNTNHPLWESIPQDARFYFVHSYFAQPSDTDTVAATTNYPTPFASALLKDNVFAVQFHPEKSQAAGLQLLNNFIRWNGN
jgi:glutamine amidotransferase